jgi:uracil-DNA glycosylase
MTDGQIPNNLAGWKVYFRDAIEEARCALMTDADRDVLVEFVQNQAQLIYYGEAPPDDDRRAGEKWWDR